MKDRVTKDISVFDGIVGIPDADNINSNNAIQSFNVDNNSHLGRLKGIETNGSALSIASGDGADIRLGAWIQNGSKWDLIYHDSNENKIKAITDFYGTPTAADLVTSNVSDNVCIISHNKEVHIGTGIGSANVPKWVGYIGYGQFGNSAPSGLQVEDANAAMYRGNSNGDFDIDSVTETTGTGTKFFVTTKRYQWAFSLVYDGYQESVPYTSAFDTPASDSEYYTIVIRAYGAATSASSFNKRISGVNVYRSDETSTNNFTPFMLVESIDINNASWTTDDTDDKIYSVVDRGYGTGATYEANTGKPADTDEGGNGRSIVNYSIACKGNDYLFVGQCYHSELTEASQIIFRSKRYRFDMFDWTTDLLRLPRKPTAIEFFNGRLYAFDQNHVYIIDPEQFFIEEVLEGIGVEGQRGVCVTPKGMFFSNKKNVWWHDGSKITPIGERIRINALSNSTSWSSYFEFTAFPDIPVLYNADKQCVMFFGDTSPVSASVSVAWAYHIERNRWDIWDLGAVVVNSNSGIFNGKDGEVYLSNTSQCVRLFAGNSNQNCYWISGKLLDDPSQKKKFYYLESDSAGTGTVTLTYGIDEISDTASSTSLVNTNEIKSGGNWQTGKNISIKIALTGTKEVRSVSLIYRQLEGVRSYA